MLEIIAYAVVLMIKRNEAYREYTKGLKPHRRRPGRQPGGV